MTEKTPQNQTDEWKDDELRVLVAGNLHVTPELRTSYCIALYNRGIITKSDLAFLSYVFGLGIRVTS